MKALLPILPLLVLVGGGCSDSSRDDTRTGTNGPVGGARTGTVEILITDAPLDPALVESAYIDITKIRLHRETDEDPGSGFVTVYDGEPQRISLANLRNGTMRGLASGKLEVGTYRQLRLHLAGAELNLKNGNSYSTADGTLDTPSAMGSSGYKVFFDPGVEVPENGRAQVLLDIDLAGTFHPVPANDPPNAREYKLRPVIRGAVMSISGELRVTVQRDDGTGTLVPVPDAMVHVLPAGEADVANAIATSITDDNGMAAVLGLLPDTYDVVASEGGVDARVDGATVVTGEATHVDLVLP